MKKLYPLIALIFIVFGTGKVYSQNNFWTFPEQYWNPLIGVSSLPTSTSYHGEPAQYVHAGIQDPYGEIVFFTIDGRVYNKNGVEDGFPMYADGSFIEGTSESLIVPQPGSCERFYIFQAGKENYDEAPYFSVYNHDLARLEDLSVSNTSIRMDNGNYFESWYDVEHPIKGVYFAATKERKDSTRWVFIANNRDLYRVNLTCTGLDSTNWKYVYSTKLELEDVDLEGGWRSEMELYEDTAQNLIKIAIPYQQHTSSGNIKVALFNIDSITGNVIPGSHEVIALLNNWDGGSTWVHGLEFTPDGKGLYIMHEKTSSFSSPLSFYNITTHTLTDLSYSNILNFKNSQLEISGDSANYTLMMAGNNYLGGIQNPDNPNPPNNWNSSAVPLNNYPINYADYYPYVLEMRKHIVPDQIDYEDYIEGIFFETCKCCEKYAYAGETKDTTYTATISETWSYGVNHNPWDAVTGDTIFIRDYLVIPAGKSVTISGMYFKFGPDARAIVKRKQGSLNAASLTLTNGTVFTADFRCARRKYHCDDPNAGCNHLEFWQGVRVEGDANDHSQSILKQGRFTMEKNSMIEYARIGILAGDETQSNYGGGIVSVKDSRLKDNETGISFDPYSRNNGTTEFYNNGGIYRSTFTTTDDWISANPPKIFVEVDQSSGLKVQGNTFENTNTTFNYLQKGIGIKTSNSRVFASWACAATPVPCLSPVNELVYRNKFISLTYGIYGLNSGQNVRTLTCNYALFQNNRYGIYLSNFIQPEILDNTFKLPGNKSYSAYGLYLTSSTGYDVQNNDFSTYSSGSISSNYGIRIGNSGAGANEIYRNHFEKLRTGGFVKGVNTDLNHPPDGSANGLKWICNTFDKPITTADIALQGSMSDEQGSCNRRADNLFSHSSTIYSSHMGLKAYYGSLTLIHYNYSHNITAYPRLVPLHYSGESGAPYFYQLSACGSSANFNPKTSCPVDLSGAPILPKIEIGFASSSGNDFMTYAALSETMADYSNQISAIENQLQSADAESELAQLKREYGKIWHEAVRQYQNDTTGIITTDEIRSLLSEYKPQGVSRFASIMLPQSDQSWIGHDNLSGIEAFTGSPLPALSNGSLPLEIPEWFESEFFATASNASALNALYIAEKSIYEPYSAEVTTIGSGWDGNLSGNSGSQYNPQLIVQPNPFNETVHFNLSNFDMEGSQNRLEFYDITGVQLYSVQVSENQTQIDISGTHFPEGIILYTLYLNNIPVENGKIVRVE